MTNLSFTIDANNFSVIWDLEENRPLATGFCFLRPDWIATAKHVVLLHGMPRKRLAVHFVGDKHFLPVEIYACHPQIDAAILRLSVPGPCKTPLFPAYARFTGQKGLISIGWTPSQKAVVANHVLAFEVDQRLRVDSEEEVIVFQSQAIEPGHSGGALIGEGGGVVGIVIEAFEVDQIRKARGTSIMTLLAGLEVNHQWRIEPASYTPHGPD